MQSMNTLLLEKDLDRDEGRRSRAYRDSKGFLTIGVGHNLDAEGLCDAAIDAQLQYDIQTKAIAPLDRHLPWYKEHPEGVQRVLANLAFNMGIKKLLMFKTTLELIRAGLYDKAADRLLTLPYAKQVGQRANRLARLLKNATKETL